MLTVAAGVVAFTVIVIGLVLVLMLVKSRWGSAGSAVLVVNHSPEHSFQVPTGGTLLATLGEQGIFLPSACGGKGTCGVCKVVVATGGGAPLPTEAALLTTPEQRSGVRLACQLKVKRDLELELPEAVLGVQSFECTVDATRNVATFIREIVLEPPESQPLAYEPGSYLQVHVPPHALKFSDFDIEPRFRRDWDRQGLWTLTSQVAQDEDVRRAYSIASAPEESGTIRLNVRIATPPAADPAAPPGKASSYLFSLKPGSKLSVSGPFGDFRAQQTEREMLFIGGGAGMAPLRSIIFDQLERLHTQRRISFWYGARSLLEAFYVEQFERLAREHSNFEWHLALSEPLAEDRWSGPTGFIHQVLYERYLRDHPAPEEIEYYLCGPPRMLEACLALLDRLGVFPENIRYDKF